MDAVILEMPETKGVKGVFRGSIKTYKRVGVIKNVRSH